MQAAPCPCEALIGSRSGGPGSAVLQCPCVLLAGWVSSPAAVLAASPDLEVAVLSVPAAGAPLGGGLDPRWTLAVSYCSASWSALRLALLLAVVSDPLHIVLLLRITLHLCAVPANLLVQPLRTVSVAGAASA
ncbi:hypothetical protein NDU88_008023 [Pleurodeles waltl]|uniref:Uncharacterized protein n=1 Tax=Pleurodeles waltl TaxID=8319 RepID=A0AAV7VVG3_PLEWA|nr:hypothetical protein NDU88_008023 [Pleurodeles waltl]